MFIHKHLKLFRHKNLSILQLFHALFWNFNKVNQMDYTMKNYTKQG